MGRGGGEDEEEERVTEVEERVMKQTEIKRTLPSRSENNPEGWERGREEGKNDAVYGFSPPFAQLKFPFLSYAVGFVFLVSIWDRGHQRCLVPR